MADLDRVGEAVRRIEFEPRKNGFARFVETTEAGKRGGEMCIGERRLVITLRSLRRAQDRPSRWGPNRTARERKARPERSFGANRAYARGVVRAEREEMCHELETQGGRRALWYAGGWSTGRSWRASLR
jgi:hypothetical protein